MADLRRRAEPTCHSEEPNPTLATFRHNWGYEASTPVGSHQVPKDCSTWVATCGSGARTGTTRSTPRSARRKTRGPGHRAKRRGQRRLVGQPAQRLERLVPQLRLPRLSRGDFGFAAPPIRRSRSRAFPGRAALTARARDGYLRGRPAVSPGSRPASGFRGKRDLRFAQDDRARP